MPKNASRRRGISRDANDQLLAQSAVDRLTSTCHEFIIEGDSCRKRQRPARPAT
jgi:DNA replication protein DnaC